MAKILFEVVLDSSGAVTGLKQVEEQVKALGTSGTTAAKGAADQDRALTSLLNKLEPTRVATERLAAQQQILLRGYQEGNVSLERYQAAMSTLEGQYEKHSQGVSNLATQFSNLKNIVMGLAAAGGIREAFSWLGDTVKLAGEAQAAQVKLEAVVKATGGAAGFTAEGLDRMATGLSRLTGIEDETVKSAEAVLLTYTHIPHDAFEPTLKAAADLAAVMGTDLTSAASMLGRVMEDPVQGMNMLRRSGIVLSETIKAQIKDLQEHGHMLEAQNLLLQQFGERMGGVAEIMGGTFAKSLEKVGNEWKNVREEAGLFLAGSEKGATTLQDVATVLGAIAEQLKKVREAGTGPDWTQGILGLLAAGSGAGGAVANLQQLAAVLGGVATSIKAGQAGYSVTVPHGEPFTTDPNAGHYTVDAAKVFEEWTKQAKEAIKKADKEIAEQMKYTEVLGTLFGIKNEERLQSFGSDFGESFGKSAIDPLFKELTTGFQLKSTQHLDPLALESGHRFGLSMGKASSDAFDDTMWTLAIRGAKAGKFADDTYWTEIGKKQGRAMSDSFSREFSKTLEDLFTGDFTKAWEGIWKDLAQYSAKTVTDAFLGTKDSNGNVLTTGIFAGGWSDMSTSQKWQTGASLAGGLIGSYGQQQNNQGMGALGGALSGAASGAMMGGSFTWVGLIVGAVVGGLAGYFGSQGPSKMGYNFQAGSGALTGYRGVGNAPQTVGGFGVDVNYGGPDVDTMKNMTQQLADKAQQTQESLRSMLDVMGQAFVNPKWSVTAGVGQSTSDVSTVFNTFLNSTMPKAIFSAFQPYLATGLGSLGVSGGRAASELAAVANSANFDAAIVKLQAYIQAVVDLQKLHEDLGKSLEQLSTELTRDTHAAWQAAMSDTLDQIGKLSENLDQLTSDEQVTRAQQIKDLTETQYENNLKYLQQILQAQQSVDQSFSDMFAGFAETRAKQSGPDVLAAYYQSQLLALADQLKAATSPESVQSITAQMQKYGTSLFNLVGQGQGDITGAGSINQQWIEQFLKQQQATADAMLQQWAQQTADANKQLSDALAGITDALNSEVTAHQDVTDALGDEVTAHQNLRQAIVDTTDALHNFRGGLDAAWA